MILKTIIIMAGMVCYLFGGGWLVGYLMKGGLWWGMATLLVITGGGGLFVTIALWIATIWDWLGEEKKS